MYENENKMRKCVLALAPFEVLYSLKHVGTIYYELLAFLQNSEERTRVYFLPLGSF